MDKLDSKERMRRFYRGEKIDRVPFMSSATMYSGKIMGLNSKEFYFDAKKSINAQKWVLEMINCDGSPCYDLPNGEILDFGGELILSENDEVSLPKIVNPINKKEDLEKYKRPNLRESLNFNTKMKFIEELNNIGIKGVHVSGGSPFTMLGSLVNPTLMMRWLRKEPQLIRELLDEMIKYLTEFAELTIEKFGVENCSVTYNFPFENNNFVSPKVFREIALPATLELHEKYLAMGIKNYGLHLCGNHNKNLECFREITLPDRSFISSDERNNLVDVKNNLGEQHIYAGNVSSNLLVQGSPEEVYKESCEIISSMKSSEANFVLMPSCDLPINAKSINLYAMLKACREKGSYID